MTEEFKKEWEIDSLPFVMDHLPEIFLRKAEKELNETPESRVEGLKDLKEMIKTERVLDEIEFHDDFLYQFLRHSKYNVKRACTRLQNFVSYRRKHCMYFEMIPFELISRLRSGKVITILPWRCPDGCPIIYAQYGKWDPELPVDDIGRIMAIIYNQCLRDPLTQITGVKLVHDLKDTPFALFRHFTPYRIHLFHKVLMDCIPARYKEIHLLNVPFAFQAIYAILKVLASAKLRKRIFFHSSPEDLLKHFPPSILPFKYGGDLKDYYTTDWMIKAREEHEKFKMGGQSNIY